MNTNKITGGENDAGDARRPPLLPALLAIACVLALLVSVDPALLSWIGLRIYVLLIAVAPGMLLALACTGWGDAVMRWALRRETGDICLCERMLLSFSCGIGIVSCGALVLGVPGWLDSLAAIILLGAGVVTGIPLWKLLATKAFRFRLVSERQTSAYEVGTASVLLVSTLIGITLLMLAAIALTPPLIFDVTEYHLGAWTDYITGTSAQFVSMPHNFYARFPFPIEALYYLGLSTAPYQDVAPKIFNALCVVACAALASMFARRLGGGRNAMMLAALVALAHPVMLDVSIDAMIDAPVALLVASSVFASFLTLGTFGVAAMPRMIIPATYLFGSALAAKYTVAQVFLLPWLVLALWPMLRANWRRPGLILFAGIIALIPCMFWLGKNFHFYGNPLEPFFVRWIRSEDAAGIAREKFYIESHFPQSPLTAAYWTSLLPRLREFQWVILVACAGWIFRRRHAAVIRILLFSAGAWMLWNLVRESQNRFLLPAMVLLSPVAVTGALAFPTAALRRVAAGILVLFAATQTVRYALTFHQSGVMDYVLDFAPTNRMTASESGNAPTGEPTPREKFYDTNLGDLGRIINDANSTLPDAANLLMIYEARPYLFRHPTWYNVVWDDSVLLDIIRTAGSVKEAWQLLREAGITHILVNRQELLRYIQQYARPGQLRRLGVRAGEDPRTAWSMTKTPADLYPPFFRDPDWQRLRPIVHTLLDEINTSATIRHGAPPPGAGVKPLDITLTPTG